MEITKYCDRCNKNQSPPRCPGFLCGFGDVSVCPICGNEILKTVDISADDIFAICDVSTDITYIEAMIDLKQKDPIEFQLKMNQFKATRPQAKVVEESSNKIKCPTCSSTNITRISKTAKVINAGMFGLLGNKRKKTFHCNSCKYEW